MNKLTFIARQYKYFVLAFLFCFFSTPSVQANADDNIENRILSLGSSVNVKYTADVKRRIRQYTIHQRQMSEVLLGRSTLYFTTFENVFREKGLPLDLKYLSVVESGLKPEATSRSGAAGLWQFMRPTGKMLGLTINRTIDERRDIEKSTEAAAEYLLHLYERFDDWTLAIAAYNCGPGNMRKAIRKAGGKKDFWAVKKYLPKETREYVPKFIAMSYVMNYYYEHDLVPNLPELDLVNTSSAKVYEKIGFSKLSKELSLDLATIKRLNPSFVRNYIPQTEDGKYLLVLPTDEMRIVANQYFVEAALPLEKKEEPVEVVQEARELLDFQPIRSLNFQDQSKESGSFELTSQNVYFVKLGGNEEENGERPDAYKIDNRQKSIIDFGNIISNVKRTL